MEDEWVGQEVILLRDLRVRTGRGIVTVPRSSGIFRVIGIFGDKLDLEHRITGSRTRGSMPGNAFLHVPINAVMKIGE
jgi:hypothetical protein